jgi:hypothetical protein
MSRHQTPAEMTSKEIDLDVTPISQTVAATYAAFPKLGQEDNMPDGLQLFGTLSTLYSTGDGSIDVQLKFSATATGVESQYALGKIRMSSDLLTQPHQLDPATYKAPVEALLSEKALNTFITDFIWDKLLDMELGRDDPDWDPSPPGVITWDPTFQAETMRMGQDDEGGMTGEGDEQSLRQSVLTQPATLFSMAATVLSNAVTSIATRVKEVMSRASSARDVHTDNLHDADLPSSRSASLVGGGL